MQAAIKGDEAQINTARLNLGYATIRAPIDGRLGARLVDAGNMVRATDAAGLVTIAQLSRSSSSSRCRRRTSTRCARSRRGRRWWCWPIGEDGKTLLATGKLTLIDNVIDQATGTIRLKATFANEDERLWPGQFVNVRVVLNMRKGVPTVPAQTVQDGPNGHYAYVIKDDDTVERRAVEVAAVQDGIAVITKGLAPGEKVVVDGQYRLTNGCARAAHRAESRGAARMTPRSAVRDCRQHLLPQGPGDEHFRTFYPSADRDLAADARHPGVRDRAPINLLPVAALPKVDFPTIVVSVSYPGASPETMASSVATPLEQQFAAISGLAEMSSTSGVGNTTITLQFDLERNIDAAAQDVQQAINAATGLLPSDLPNPPTYRKTNPADRPVLIYAVHSDAMPIYRIDDYAYTIIAQKLATR